MVAICNTGRVQMSFYHLYFIVRNTTMLGEVRRHSKNGLYYVHEFHPDTERRSWLRLDTFIWGEWRNHPNKTTTPAMLITLSDREQKAIVRKYQRSPSTIETTKKSRPKKSSRQRPSPRARSSKACNSFPYKKCPKHCTPVRGSRNRRAYCRRR
jgi:hypothetical protein